MVEPVPNSERRGSGPTVSELRAQAEFDSSLVDAESPPVFIITCARSGSTLLRLLCDAHDDIACPPETGLAGALAKLTSAWHVVCSADAGRIVAEPPPEVVLTLRQAGTALMRYHCRRQGKRVFCDKSLDSVDYLPVIEALFPGSRYIVLYRKVMDVISSAIEASPWGFDAYGFGPYIIGTPGNHVAGLASYWSAYVSKALECEQTYPQRTCRLRYEDLVMNPRAELSRLFAFMGVSSEGYSLSRAFNRPAVFGLPGDYKALYMDRLSDESVGRGRLVPVGMIPPALLEATNRQLALLGYEALDPVQQQSGGTQVSTCNDGVRELTRLLTRWGPSAMSRLTAAVEFGGDEGGGGRKSDVWRKLIEVGPFKLVLDDDPKESWLVDPIDARVTHASEDPTRWFLAGDAKTFLAISEGEANCGALLRSGRLRSQGENDIARNNGALVLGVELLLREARGLLSQDESEAAQVACVGLGIS